MLPRAAVAIALLALAFGPAAAAGDSPDAGRDNQREACKRAMNARIQVCADECTRAALAAVPGFIDKNNDVKFGCIKQCGMRAIIGGQGCASGGN